ncbi:MAG: response regulator [Deltaproteobacteria bacterium]|nr:response regulator [Deltaproteobacteria bacterium]
MQDPQADTGTHEVWWPETRVPGMDTAERRAPPLAPTLFRRHQSGSMVRMSLALVWALAVLFAGGSAIWALLPAFYAMVAWVVEQRLSRHAALFRGLMVTDIALISVFNWHLGAVHSWNAAFYFPMIAGHAWDGEGNDGLAALIASLTGHLTVVLLEAGGLLAPVAGGVAPGFAGLLDALRALWPLYLSMIGLYAIVTASSRRTRIYLDHLREAHGEQIALKEQQVALNRRLSDVERMEALERLSGSIAHDFNNYLAGIRGMAEVLLEDQQDNTTSADDIRAIRDAAASASGLALDLLAFSKHSGGGTEVIDLALFLEDLRGLTLSLLGPSITLKVVKLADPCTIQATRDDLRRIVLNLVTNARDAMPAGGTLTLTLWSGVDEGSSHAGERRVELRLEDTGAGMSSEVLQHLFEPFYTTKSEQRGSGLGLATVYGLMMRHRGSIRVASHQGRGARFTLSFPVAATHSHREDPPVPLPARLTGRVLLAEDDPMVRGVVSRLLRRAGHQIAAVASAEEALQWLDDAPWTPQVLLTDVIMPGRNGVELASMMRGRVPDLRVVFMSGFTGAALESQVGPVHHAPLVLKPFAAEDLSRALDEVLRTPPPPLHIGPASG